MKKLFFLLLAIGSILYVNAQQQPAADSLKEYTGKYVFPEGSEVTEINVLIENGLLMATSAQGSSELKRIDKDTFEVVVYTGTATFKRDDKGTINGLHIEVGNLIIDGKKAEEKKSVNLSVGSL